MRHLFLLVIILLFVFSGCGCNETKQDSVRENSKEPSNVQSESSQVDSVKQSNLPLKNAERRITKKPFGIYITPGNSPISPERFSGYHTGIDYEIFNREVNTEVDVSAICTGEILQKKNVSGYGGVMVQECKLDNQLVTVLYGHLNLSEVKKKVGDSLKKGEKFAVLGDAFSSETGGERKHLHLGIHKGNGVDLRGYVQSKSQLEDWLDFARYY